MFTTRHCLRTSTLLVWAAINRRLGSDQFKFLLRSARALNHIVYNRVRVDILVSNIVGSMSLCLVFLNNVFENSLTFCPFVERKWEFFAVKAVASAVLQLWSQKRDIYQVILRILKLSLQTIIYCKKDSLNIKGGGVGLITCHKNNKTIVRVLTLNYSMPYPYAMIVITLESIKTRTNGYVCLKCEPM